jgi:hypothetical protein
MVRSSAAVRSGVGAPTPRRAAFRMEGVGTLLLRDSSVNCYLSPGGLAPTIACALF